MTWEKVRSFFESLTLQKLLPVVVILVAGVVAVKLLMKLFDRALNKSKLERTMFTIIKAILRSLLYVIVILIAASSLGVDVTSLVALLSIVSLAISLAVQNTLSNVVGSFTLLSTHPFHVGDFVQIGEERGTVEEVTMNYTRLCTFDGKVIFIPNSDASSSRIYNYSLENRRRIELKVQASYGDDIDKVKAALEKAATHPKRLKDSDVKVFVNEYKDCGVEYLLLLWATEADYFEVKFAVTEAIKRTFDQEGITIPFPQIEVTTK